MDTRTDILSRIRDRLGRDPGNAAAARERVAATLAARTPGPRPSVPDDPVARFRTKSEQMASTVDRVAALNGVPAAVARYLSGAGLPLGVVCWPTLADLPWAAAGIEAEARGARDADLVGITGCFCAVAETGTLVLCSGPGTPATVSLLPETHVALVPAERIVPAMEDAWRLARAELGEMPRAVNFVSGPSRTADIEQTLVLGAHGPYRVHIVIVG